jgi:hypothetical protein
MAVETRLDEKPLSPLEYMLTVMNDPSAENERRDRMAYQAAPLMHAKATDPKAVKLGKKEVRQNIADAAATTGKFAIPAGPRLVKP